MLRNLLTFGGRGQSLTDATLSGSVETSSALITCPRNFVSHRSKVHFPRCSRKFTHLMAVKTSRKLAIALLNFSLCASKSSKYTTHGTVECL